MQAMAVTHAYHDTVDLNDGRTFCLACGTVVDI